MASKMHESRNEGPKVTQRNTAQHESADLSRRNIQPYSSDCINNRMHSRAAVLL